MIINGDIPPGERINEAHFARDMDISRGPIREALTRLQAEGLVTYQANHGMRVSTLSAQDAYEVYTLRGLLEQSAVLMAMPRLSGAHIARLETILNDFKDAFYRGDRGLIVESDREFHHTVVAASGHLRLLQIHEQLDALCAVMYMTVANHVPLRLNHVIQNHQLLLDALQSGDANFASHAFSQHYLEALDQLQGHLSDT